MNESVDPDKTKPASRPALEGLDPRLLMAEGLGLDPEASEVGETPGIPGYEIHRLLGSGGMGRVWLARQTSLDRLVAVKVLATGGLAATQWLDRLEREARSMARLSHPNIVGVYDFVRIPDGAAIIMEWVGSGTLREKWLAGRKPVRDLGTVTGIVRQIAASLVAAHGAGIIHRDLKPENVLVAVDGSVKVTDFGLALPAGAGQDRLTLTGTSVGTVGYMAPEQLEGREVDARADLYSLGVILYELVTGIRPQGHFDRPRTIRRDLPVALEKLILDSLRTRPQKRIASAQEFLSRLNRANRSGFGKIAAAAAIVLLLVGASAFAWKQFPRGGSGTRFEDTDTRVVPTPPTEPEPGVPDKTTTTRAGGVSVPEAWTPYVSVKPVSGKWLEEKGGWQSDPSKAILQVLTALPSGNFRVRVSFTRLEGPHSVAIFFRTPRGFGTAELSTWEQHLAGFQHVDGLDLRSIPGSAVLPIENGRRYEMELEFLPDRMRFSLDGRLIQEIERNRHEFGITYPWEWETLDTTHTALAIGSYESPTVFHSIGIEKL